jgi:hypothetical protein
MGKNCNFSVNRLYSWSVLISSNRYYLYGPFDTSTSPSALPLSSQSVLSNADPVDAVALCKAGVIKYTPLGVYPGGSDDVKAALNYCNSLG